MGAYHVTKMKFRKFCAFKMSTFLKFSMFVHTDLTVMICVIGTGLIYSVSAKVRVEVK